MPSQETLRTSAATSSGSMKLTEAELVDAEVEEAVEPESELDQRSEWAVWEPEGAEVKEEE